MTGPLRILSVMPFPPRLDSTHGGGKVMAQFLENLAGRHRVAVVYFRAPDEQPADELYRTRCDLLEEIDRPWAGRSLPRQAWRAARLLSGLTRGRPFWISDWYTPAAAARIRALVDAWQPDVIQFENHIMGQYHNTLAGRSIPRVLVVHEPGVASGSYIKQVPAAVNRPLAALDRRAWHRFEPGLVAAMDAAVVFTARDRQILQGFHTPTPVEQIPFGVPIPAQPLNPRGGQPLTILFVGSFIHPPNIEAALLLAREIFPRVQARLPQVRLRIVGPEPPPELLALAGADITITGRVPDITPYLDQAALVAAPVFSGSGMRVKVLEALSAGKALAATPLAVEGLDLVDGEQAAIADGIEGLSQRIAALLSDEASRTAMAGRARTWACEHLSWERSVKRFEDLYAGLMERTK